MTTTIYELGKKFLPSNLKSISLKHYFKLINLIKYKTTDMFSFIEFQTITTCNRRCHFCPISSDPLPRELLSMNLLKKLLAELKEIDYSGWFSPHLYGEPLLDKRMEEIFRLSKKYIPKANNVIYSNGDLLTTERFRSLVKFGCDLFIISQYDEQMSKTIKKLFSEISAKERKKINYRIINDDSPLSNRGGTVKVKNLSLSDCPTESVFINVKGEVIICSNDYYSTAVLGDLKKQRLMDIWNSRQYSEIRKELRKNIYRKTVCKKCKGSYSK